MAKNNSLLDALNNKYPDHKAQSSGAASTGNSGRSITSQNDAFKQALEEEPSTYKLWNPETEQPEQKKRPGRKSTTTHVEPVATQPEEKQNSNPWEMELDDSDFEDEVKTPAQPKQEKKPFKIPGNDLTPEDVWSNSADSPELMTSSYDPNAISKIGDWFKNVGKAAATGTASSLTGAQRLLYEAGQKARTSQYEEDIADLQHGYERALYDYQIALEDGVTGSELQSYQNVIDSYKTKLDAYNKVIDEGVQEQATKATSELANQLQEESSKYTEYAKSAAGDNWLGNIATDVAVNGLQMAGDAAMNLVAPGTSLAAMGLRTFGSAGQEAEAEGATLAQQLGYGAVKGGIEMATELMFDGLAGAYGKGSADDIVEEVIRKITKSGNEAERTALRTLFAGMGEAAEEGISGGLDPFVKMIYQGIGSLPENINADWAADTIYSMIVGFAMGGGMTSVNVKGNAESNANLRETDTIQANLEAEGFSPEAAQKAAPIINKANSGETISNKERNTLLEIIKQENVQAGTNVTTSPVAATPTNTTPAGRTEAVGTTPVVAETGNNLENAAQQAAANNVAETAQDNALLNQIAQNEEAAPANPLAAATTEQINAHSEAIERLQSMPESTGRDEAIQEHLQEIARLQTELETQAAEANPLVRNPEAAAEGIAPEQAQEETSNPASEIATETPAGTTAPEMPAAQPVAATPTGDAKAARGAKSAPNPTPETHIDNRTPENVASKKVNAFQWDVPEIKPFFKKAAALLRRDLANSQESHTVKKAGGGNNARVTNYLLNKVFSMFNSTQEAIDACESIIYDKGRENFADPKRIELILDEMLTDGYIPRDSSLPRLNPDTEYAAVKGSLEGGTPYENDARARAINNILESDFDGTMTEEDAAAEADRNFENTGYYDPITKDGQTALDIEEEEAPTSTIEEIDNADTAEIEEKYGKQEEAAPTEESQTNTEEKAEEPAAPKAEEQAEETTAEAETTEEETAPEEKTAVSPERAAQIGDEINSHLEAINELQNMPESDGRNDAIAEHNAEIQSLLQELTGKTTTETTQTTQTNAETTQTNTGAGTGTGSTTTAAPNTESRNSSWVPPVGEPGKKTPKVSKTSTNSMRNTAEQVGGTQEALYYMPKSEKESLTNAMARVDADMLGEMQSLMNKEMWTGEDGDTASLIFRNLMIDAVQSKDRTAVDAWGKVLQQHKTENARALQATAKWARTGAAAAIVASSDIDANNNLTTEQKADLKDAVYDAAQRFDSVEEDDLGSLRSLILDLNQQRNTGTFGAKNFEKILNKVNDFEYLKEFALRQIMAIPNDATNQADIGQQLKTWQVNAQLLRLGTFFRNFFGNASFGAIDTFAQNAFGYAIDSAISKIAKTGHKEVGFDKGWLSKNARNAAVDAMNRSILEIAADVDMSGNASKYGTTSSRTNKMTGGKFEQFMSRWEQLLAYSLNTSDKLFRGQIETSFAEGLGDLSEADRNALAQAVADYRLFQNQGAAANISKVLHDLLNYAGVGGELTSRGRQGGFGLGDLINPYPGVPANLAVKALEYSPANIVKGFGEVVKLIRDTKAGKQVTGQQMQAAMDIARGITGVPVIMLFTALAKTKLFRNSDDEKDYDVAAENAAQGLSGIQWNLDATLRALDGEQADWRDGDQLMKVSWLEPLNAFMSIGSMIADENEDHTLDSYISNYLKGALMAAMDMPVMENIQNAVNTIRYADSDNIWKTAGEAGAQLLGDAAGGMIPAPISQLARVTDDYVRDTKGDTKAETAFNSLLNSLPGFRNQLPVKTDNFGNARLNEPNEILRALNSFVLPGAINTFQETDVQDEVSRLYETSGDVALYPDRNGPKSITFGSKKYDLSADEQRAYHEYAGSKSEEYVKGLIESDYYKGLTDSQKAEAIKEAYSIAKDLAKSEYAKEKGISYTSDYQKLFKGVDKPGTSDDRTALNESNLPDYIAFTTGFKDGVKTHDYKTIDEYVANYSSLDKNLRKVISERSDDFRAVKKYADIGVKSKGYYSYKSALERTQADLDKNGTASGNAKLMALAKANLTESERKKIITGLKKSDGNYDFGSNAVAAYTVLSKYGFTTKDVSNFFNEALNCKTAKDTGKIADQNGVLRPDTVAYALSQMSGLTDSERSKIYNKIKSEVSNYYNDWKNYSYSSEINYIKNNKYYTYGSSLFGNGKSKNDLLAILAG